MKTKHIFLITALVVLADQALKIYIKTTMPINTSQPVFGNWFQLYFVENPGMAYGWKFGGNWGKLILTVFRLAAVIFGTFYLKNIIKLGYTKGFIICASLIYAGAIGNLIDSCFYGLVFDKGMLYDAQTQDYSIYNGLANFSKNGYAGFLHGNVVDMLYFPIIHGTFPAWFPVWGGESFEFFRPIFNIADAAISTGVITILVFQKRFLKPKQTSDIQSVETTATVDDNTQIS